MLIYSVFVHIYTMMILLIRNFAYDSDYYMQEENILTHKKLTFLLTEKVVRILKIKKIYNWFSYNCKNCCCLKIS